MIENESIELLLDIYKTNSILERLCGARQSGGGGAAVQQQRSGGAAKSMCV